MADLQSVLDRITLDYLNRTDLNSVATREVKSAIRHYERRRWPWNEATTTLTCVASQSYLSVPADFLVLDRLEVQAQSTNTELLPSTFNFIQSVNCQPGASNNIPTYFAIRANRFELASIPDSAYPVNCYYIKQLAALSATSDTNKWLSAAEDLIVYRATKMVWANVLRNADQAMIFQQLENSSFLELSGYHQQHNTTGLKATPF